MAANYENTYTMNLDINQLVAAIRDPAFASKLNLDFKSENPSPTGIWYRFHHGVTFTSWGEKVTVTLTPVGYMVTQLHIHSVCAMPTQVADWGKNRQVVCNIFEYLQANAYRYPAPQQPQQAVPQPQQAAPQPQFSQPVCKACGKLLASDNLFCGYCGTKVQ